MDGFEATRKINDLKRTDKIRKNLPVIALTANAMKGDRQRCLDAGMDDYISKPVRTHDLREKVFEWVSRQKTGIARTHTILPEEEIMQTSLPANNDILDMTAVIESKQILKDKYPSMLNYYVEDVTNYMDEIRTALETGIIKSAIRPAHTIKSSSRRMGAAKLSDLAKDLELAANEDDCEIESLRQKLGDMTVVFESTRNALIQESRKAKTG
jgi:DNA-binding response OmpR family regulator